MCGVTSGFLELVPAFEIRFDFRSQAFQEPGCSRA
jgi:hypothetical protein